ncbi:hypothetical protein RUM44_008959 [Polyplax serrata]|uniref:Uncharacterized protein n=1 Tax=Polyplax serrata TaxID=468196 RepID=A0ABR1ARD0_POLSC
MNSDVEESRVECGNLLISKSFNWFKQIGVQGKMTLTTLKDGMMYPKKSLTTRQERIIPGHLLRNANNLLQPPYRKASASQTTSCACCSASSSLALLSLSPTAVSIYLTSPTTLEWQQNLLETSS